MSEGRLPAPVALRLVALGTLGLLVIHGLLLTSCGRSKTRPAGTGRIRLDVGGVTVTARVARTPTERRRGLQGIAHLEPEDGMLLIYPEPRRMSIWMKDCLVPLDVAFIDAGGRITQIQRLEAPRRPADVPERTRAHKPSVMVLEMPAGFFQRHGLDVGTRVILPAGVRSGASDTRPRTSRPP